MKKEQPLKVIPLTRCSTIDQLSDAVKQKEIFIEIADELKEEFMSKIKAAFKDKNSTDKLFLGITVPETFVIGAFMGASIQISILAELCLATFMKKCPTLIMANMSFQCSKKIKITDFTSSVRNQ